MATATHTVKRGTGIAVDDHTEIFQFGKDWLLFDFDTMSGHWFHGKREAMSFLKQFGIPSTEEA